LIKAQIFTRISAGRSGNRWNVENCSEIGGGGGLARARVGAASCFSSDVPGFEAGVDTVFRVIEGDSVEVDIVVRSANDVWLGPVTRFSDDGGKS
jgi:hypothetical protein